MAMYRMQHIDPVVLAGIKVRRQEEIVRLLGVKFDPVKALITLKKESKDFSEDSREAREADALFVQLLKREGIELPPENIDKPKGDTAEQEHIRIKRKALETRLKLLKLELELAA